MGALSVTEKLNMLAIPVRWKTESETSETSVKLIKLSI